MAQVQSELQSVLQEEIGCLASVLDISRRALEKFDKMSIPVIQEILGFRQEQIEKIQRLEDRRQRLGNQDAEEKMEPMIRRMSELATELVEVDEHIHTALERKKMAYLRQLSQNGSLRSHQKWERQAAVGQGSRVDITQG